MMSKSGYPVEDAILQLGNGYDLEFEAIAHLLDVACKEERGRLPMDELASIMGVADRQAKHLAALACGLGILQKVTYRPTKLGYLIQECDPFFDDVGTLWFLHYSISADRRHIIWNRIVNDFLPNKSRFTREQIRTDLDSLNVWFSETTMKKHVSSELKTFLNAYTQQAFSRLAFLRQDGDNYSIGYRQPVHSLVIAACISRYRSNQRPGDTAIPISELCCSPCSPGLVFQILEERFRTILEDLKNQPGFSLESRADLDQVGISTSIDDVELMRRYYESR